MNYKVYELEDKTTASGKALKKLVLQGEGKQYPDKNVTMWSDHPLFDSVAVGQSIDVEIDVKESTTPNPLGGFFKNKTVLKGGESFSKTPGAPDANRVEAKVDALRSEIATLGATLTGMKSVLADILSKVDPAIKDEPF
jgi:hypothetical protein